MKRTLFIFTLFILVAFTNSVFAQIETKVFTIDLGVPTTKSLRSLDSTTKRLVIPCKCPLAFNLVNGNPYKYRYVVNSKLVNFFEGQVPVPFDSIVKILAKPKEQLKNDSTGKTRLETMVKIKPLYQSQAPFAIGVIKKEAKIASELNIEFKDPESAKDDEKIILDAQKILDRKTSNLKNSIDLFIATISSEDYLDKKMFGRERDTFRNSYSKLSQDISALNSEATIFPNIKKDYQKSLLAIGKISTEISIEIGKMYQLRLSDYLFPVDINGKNIDVVEITLKRYDKSSANASPEEFVYNIWVTGGVKIDVSGGVFVTSIVDKEYATRDTLITVNNASTTYKKIYEKDKGNYDFGFGSTINVSYRFGGWVKPALSFGALFTANQKFQILAGGGIILGKEERVILHYGLSMGTMSQIAQNLKADGSVVYNLGTTGQVPVTDKFAFGQFFGLTYNLGKTKTQAKTKE